MLESEFLFLPSGIGNILYLSLMFSRFKGSEKVDKIGGNKMLNSKSQNLKKETLAEYAT